MSDEPYQITERGDPRDRIANQRPLFDVDRTTDTRCPLPGCHAIRYAGEQRTVSCEYELVTSYIEGTRRPKGCLNAHDPAHAPFPDGY